MCSSEWLTFVFILFFWVPWTARRSKQTILKEVNSEYSLEELIWSWSSNTLVTWYKQPTHWKRPWCWRKTERRRKRGSRWITKSQTWLGDWTATNQLHRYYKLLSYPFHYANNTKITPFRTICINHCIF